MKGGLRMEEKDRGWLAENWPGLFFAGVVLALIGVGATLGISSCRETRAHEARCLQARAEILRCLEAGKEGLQKDGSWGRCEDAPRYKYMCTSWPRSWEGR